MRTIWTLKMTESWGESKNDSKEILREFHFIFLLAEVVETGLSVCLSVFW